MSIENLFELDDEKYTNKKTEEIKEELESKELLEAKVKSKKRFYPDIDYSEPANFARYGLAEKYYKDSIEHIQKRYPWDGSEKELTEWRNKSSYLELYLVDNTYPSRKGSIRLNSSYVSLGVDFSGSLDEEYHSSNTLQSISFKSGPNPDSSYDNASATQTFSEGSKANNIEADLDHNVKITTKGNTVEFWYKRDDSAIPSSSVCHTDIWNRKEIQDPDYSRIVIESLYDSTSTEDNFYLTRVANSSSVNDRVAFSGSLDFANWHHYAFVFGADGSAKLYIDGEETHKNETTSSFSSSYGPVACSIGAYLKEPHESVTGSISFESGKVGGQDCQIDDFRIWNSARTEKEIKRNWFRNVFGGTNTDESNRDLGIYYKFNEGFANNETIDSTIFDYSGRSSHAKILNYDLDCHSDNTPSKLQEKGDPIIYPQNSEVVSFTESMIEKAVVHDLSNHSSLYKSVPQWIRDEDEKINSSVMKNLMQIMASYLDTVHLQIENLPKIADTDLETKEESDIFIKSLLRNQGYVVPEILADAELIESISDRTESKNLEKQIKQIKDQIYRNIYNNSLFISKSKGTEKAFRNMIRCFGVDNELIKIRNYVSNSTRKLKDTNRYEATHKKNYVDFSKSQNKNGNIYQADFISGSVEIPYTFQLETIFPYTRSQRPEIDYPIFTTSSLGGIYSCDATGAVSSSQAKISFVRDGNDGHFRLDFGDTVLTSSNFEDVYDNQRWNISLRVHDKNRDVNFMNSHTGDYEVVFSGISVQDAEVQSSFSVSHSSASYSASLADNKKLFIGADKTNASGSVNNPSDLKITSVRFWADSLEDENLKLHAYNPSSYGHISPMERTLQNISLNPDNKDVFKKDTLLLNWDFLSNQLPVMNRVPQRDLFEPLNGIYSANDGISTLSSTDSSVIFENMPVFGYRDDLPQYENNSDRIKITEEEDVEDRIFYFNRNTPSVEFSVEKSMSAIIDDHILNHFANLSEFNQLLSPASSREQTRYKQLEFLRRKLFTEEIKNEPDLERFLEFYKWLDNSVRDFVYQITPASSGFSKKIFNVIESSMLERSKYSAPAFVNRADSILDSSKEPELESNTNIQPQAGGDTDTQSDGTTTVAPDTTGDTDDFASRNFTEIFSPKISFTETNGHQFSPVENLSFRNSEVRRFLDKYWTAKALFVTDAIDSSEMSYVEDTLSSSAYSIRKNATEGIKKSNYPTLRRDFPNSLLRRGDYRNFVMSGDSMLANPQVRNVTYNLEADLDYVKISKQFDDPYADDTLRNKSLDIQTLTKMKEEISSEGDNIKSISYTQKLFPKRTKFEQASFYQNENKKSGNKSTFFREGVLNRIKQANEPNYLDWSEDIFYKPLYGQIESLWPFDHYKLEDKDTGLKVTIDGELSFKKASYYKDMLTSVAESSPEITADKYFNLQFDRSDLSEIVFPSNLEQCNEATAKKFLAEYKEDKNTFGKSRSLFEEVDFNNVLHSRYTIDEDNSNNTKVILRNSLLENFEIDRKYWTELDNSVDDKNPYLTTDFTQKLENKIKLKPSAAKVNITKSPAPQLKYLYTPYGYNEFYKNEIKTSNYSDEYSPNNDFLVEDFEYAEVPVHSLNTSTNTGLTSRIDKQRGLFASERTGESSYKIYNNFTKKYSKDGLGMLPVTSFSGKNMSSYDGYEHFDSSNVFVPKGGIGLKNSFRLPLREVSPYNHLPGWKKLNNEPIILSGCEINSSVNTNEYMQVKVDKIRRGATSEESISLQDTPFALSTWFSVDKSVYEGSSDLGIFCLSQCKESKSDAYFSVFLKQSNTNSGPLVVYLNDGQTIDAAKNSSEQTDRTFYFFKDNNGAAQEISYSDIDSLSNLIFQFTPASATAPAMIKLHLNGEQLYGIQKNAYDLSAGVYYSACPIFTTDAWGSGTWGKDINHINRIKSVKIGNASPDADAKYKFSGVVFQTSLFSGILSKSSAERIYNGGVPVNALEQYANDKVVGIENIDDGNKEFGSKAPYLGTLPGTYGRPPYAFGVDKSGILSGLLEFCALHNLGFPSYHEPSTRSVMKSDDFWENKAYSDKLKISEVIKTFPEQNKVKTKLVTKIEANKNFVPLNGFYPLQRVAQIGELFQEAVIPSLKTSTKTTPSKQLNSIIDMWSYAMFNTMRWGVEHSAPIYNNTSGINGFNSFEQTEIEVTKIGDGNDSLGLTLPPLGTSSVHRNTIVPDIYLDKKSRVGYDDLFVSSVPLNDIVGSEAFADLKTSQPKFNEGLENYQAKLGLLICRESDETFGKEYVLYPNQLFDSLKETESSIDVGDFRVTYKSHPENIFSLYGDYYYDLTENNRSLKIHNAISSSPSFSLAGMKEGAAVSYQEAITNFTDSAAEFRKDKSLIKFESNIVRARFVNGETYAMRLSFSKSQNYTPISFYDNQGRFNPGMILGSPHKFQQTKDYNYNDFTSPLSYVPHISPHYYEDEVIVTYKHDLPTGEYRREEILRNVLEKRSIQYNDSEISRRILASLGMTTDDVLINDFIESSAYKNRKKITDCIDLARVNDDGNWQISLKQELPIIDYYEKVPASEAKLLGMEYKNPEQSDTSGTSGVYLQIEDVVGQESLRIALGFGAKEEITSSKICDFADSMTLGEATVTIPFVRQKMDRTTEVAGIYLLNDDFFVGTADNLQTHRDKLSSYYVSSEIPLDSTLFSIAEVEHKFYRDDIINMWQNVCPKVEIENSTHNTELEFGKDFVCPENIEIEFLVFKVKKKGEHSNESYNWPHDFYSLIDTASVSCKIECEYGEE